MHHARVREDYDRKWIRKSANPVEIRIVDEENGKIIYPLGDFWIAYRHFGKKITTQTHPKFLHRDSGRALER